MTDSLNLPESEKPETDSAENALNDTVPTAQNEPKLIGPYKRQTEQAVEPSFMKPHAYAPTTPTQPVSPLNAAKRAEQEAAAAPSPASSAPTAAVPSAAAFPQNVPGNAPYGTAPVSVPPVYYGGPTPPGAVPPAGMPPYPPAQPTPRRPWVYALVGGLAGMLIGAACVAGCTAVALHGTMMHHATSQYNQGYSQDFDQPYTYDYDNRDSSGNSTDSDDAYDPYEMPYGHNFGNGTQDDSQNSRGGRDEGTGNSSGNDTSSGNKGSSARQGYTLEEIESALGAKVGSLQDGKMASGAYIVGKESGVEPGLYFLEGSQSKESKFFVFSAADQDSYELDASVLYIGSYFVELEEGDLLVYLPAEDSDYAFDAADATLDADAPYESGLYRVGTDIPAGTYTITVSSEKLEDASQENAAYVMTDLDFTEDSIVDTKYVIAGSSQEVQLKDGQWLELYGAIATPKQ